MHRLLSARLWLCAAVPVLSLTPDVFVLFMAVVCTTTVNGCWDRNHAEPCSPVCNGRAVQLLHWTAKDHCFGVRKGVQVVAEVDQPQYVSLATKQPKTLQRLLVLERLQDPGNLVCTVQLSVALYAVHEHLVPPNRASDQSCMELHPHP